MVRSRRKHSESGRHRRTLGSLVGLRSLKVFGGQTIGSMLKTAGAFNEENKERKERGIVASVGREETLGNQTTRDRRASERGAWRLRLSATLVCSPPAPPPPRMKIILAQEFEWRRGFRITVIGRDGSISTEEGGHYREKRARFSTPREFRVYELVEITSAGEWLRLAFLFPLILCYLTLSLSFSFCLLRISSIRNMLDRRFRISG